MKLQFKGLTVVGIILFAAVIVIAIWAKDMSENALMSASSRYHPVIPAVKPVDITQAPQCAPGYDKPWVGCQSLAQ